MKRLIYMLLLFVVLGHTVFAQEQKAEPLEVRLLDGFFPLGADWYRAQKDAWQVELKKDKRNEKAWENYWVACNAEYQEAKLVWWKDSLQVQRLRREQHGIVKKMKKWIPDTRTYYRHLLDLETDEGKREVIQQKIQESEKERKAIAGVTKLARERAKKANLHNRKLRDCRIHLNDPKGKGLEEDSCIFITEGDSASGSITKSRDVNTQAVFSLRGKPLNSFGLTKKVVYENEEFNLLQAALNIEDGIEGLRYNKVIVATDADVDGMHIRLLLITFFLQFFPDLIKKGHVYILQTPLFRVRNKKKTNYCYSEEERINAINELGPNPEITRFKGLGEISPDEFKHFIGKDMRLEQVTLRKTDAVKELLEFYMGKNTMERQNFIIDNLVIEEDLAS